MLPVEAVALHSEAVMSELSESASARHNNSIHSESPPSSAYADGALQGSRKGVYPKHRGAEVTGSGCQRTLIHGNIRRGMPGTMTGTVGAEGGSTAGPKDVGGRGWTVVL